MLRNNYRYLNGNYLVKYDYYSRSLIKRGLRFNEPFLPDFPDSIDLKITNKCEWGCPWCHESSNKNGKSFSLKRTKKILSELPEIPIEIAIGGGNVLDIPEETLELVKWLMSRNNQPRITINYKDIKKHWNETNGPCFDLVREIQNMGISLDSAPVGVNQYDSFSAEYKESKYWSPTFASNTIGNGGGYSVFHIIAGLFPPNDIITLRKNFRNYPILILGFKQWGRAKNSELPIKKLKETEKIVEDIISNPRYETSGFNVLGFDNLALEQLHIKEKLPKEIWNRLYFGDEGTHSMYVDAVNEKFAVTSRSADRVSWNDIGLIDYFKKISHDRCNN